MFEDLQSPSLCRIRTVSSFIHLTKNTTQWRDRILEAKVHCDAVANFFQKMGYVVQSISIITNPFGEFLTVDSIDSAKEGLKKITNILNEAEQSFSQGLRIRFAIGEAQTAEEIQLLPELIQSYGDLCNACVNVEADALGILDNAQLVHCAQVIKKISQITARGEGNFNFTVNFNCPSYIPYFPASYHRSEHQKAFVLGLETPDLLVAALEVYRTQTQTKDLLSSPAGYQAFMQGAFEVMTAALQYHIDKIQTGLETASLNAEWQYLGMDTSAAPSKNCSSMVEVYQCLGLPHFGASGTVEISALLTRVFKSLKRVNAVGFSGLMLAVTEDEGLAAATRTKQFDIRSLLTYSSVCGIGLDTVPIPGEVSIEQLCALMRDTGTMAFRLNKPLTVRVFPVPNTSAGELTTFESDDLCNCAVLAVS
ncbi:DUF711 family protein [Suttonella ornithocola]